MGVASVGRHWLPIQSSVEASHFVTSLQPMSILRCVHLCSMSNWIWVGRWSQLLQLCLTLKRYGSLHGLWKTFIEECPQKVFLSFWRGPYDCRGKPRIALLENSLQNTEWSTVQFLVVVFKLPQDCFAQFSSYSLNPASTTAWPPSAALMPTSA